MAARSIWTGSITIGLLNVPVKLFPAIKRKSIAFNQVDEKTGSRIRYQKVSEATGEIVPSDHIVKGFDLGGDNFVIIDDQDLKPLSPVKTKEIGIESFVPASQIPDVMFDAPYLLAPGKAPKPYALLAQALEDTGRVAIGKFVMRQKEYLAVIRSDGGRLTLSTMVFPDELVDPALETDLDSVKDVALSDRELAMANSLVEALSDPFEPDKYQDTYRASVMELIEAKAEGRTLTIADPPSMSGHVVDLAAALEASVEAAKAARGRHPTARPVSSSTAPPKPVARQTRSA